MEDTMEGPPIKRKLFSNKSLCNIRAALRRGQNDLFIEESSGSNPDLKSTLARQRFARMGLAQNLSSASSRDLSDLIPAQRAISEPRILGKLHKQPLNVLYPSLDGLELLRTLGTIKTLFHKQHTSHSMDAQQKASMKTSVPEHLLAGVLPAATAILKTISSQIDFACG